MALRPYIVGNWKMNGTSADLNEADAIAALAKAQPAVDVALCPPATLVRSMADRLPELMIGGQDCHDRDNGAFTGSISAPMLADAGAKLVIVGHSERRDAFGETDATVAAKAAAALKAGLAVIICVGEPLAVREAGDAEAHVLAQVAGSVPAGFDAARLAVAYEPIWAIGTGLTPTRDDIAAMHAALRAQLTMQHGNAGAAVRLLYGGSVSPDNAAEILSLDDVNGALVGGASLTAAKFGPIIAAGAAS